MVDCRRLVAVVVASLFVAVAVHADLMPVSDVETGVGTGLSASGQSESQPSGRGMPSDPLVGPGDMALASIDFPVEMAGGETGRERVVTTFVDRSDSVDLCLYALLGLGLFRSSHWVRKPSLGFIPEWYHSGAPHQIGHSHVIGPDALCSTAVCFVQPDCSGENQLLQYGAGTVASLRRTSQFTPNVLSSRGPPA